MKIVVQNGNNVGKIELEKFVSTIPSAWKKLFSTIVVYGSRSGSLEITHHEKEGVLGIHCPDSYKGDSVETLNEVAICLGAINVHGHIPSKISSTRRKDYLAEWEHAKNT